MSNIAFSWQSFFRKTMQWLWEEGSSLQNHKAMNEIYNMMFILLSPRLRPDLGEVHPVRLYERFAEDAVPARAFWACLRDEFFPLFLSSPTLSRWLVLHAATTSQDDAVFTLEHITYFRESQAETLRGLFRRFFPIFYDVAGGTWRLREDLALAEYDPIGSLYMDVIANGYGAGTNRDIGSFFTPRPLTHEIVARVDPDWSMRCSDLACGTGGFLTAIAQHVQRKLEREQASGQISREEYARRWHHFVRHHLWGIDISMDVLKPLGIHLLAHDLVEALPHMLHANALHVTEPDALDAFDCIVINPPFGKKTQETPRRFVDLRSGRMVEAPTDDSESYWKWVLNADKKSINRRCGLQFVMAQYRMLRPGGRGAFLIDAGFLSNRDAYQLRKGLLTHTTVTDVCLCPSGTFHHTGITTCYILYQKQGRTDTVRMWWAGNDQAEPVRVSLAQIKAKDWSLAVSDWCPALPVTVNTEQRMETVELLPAFAAYRKQKYKGSAARPIPSLARQEEIVSLLDMWAALSEEQKMELMQEYETYKRHGWRQLHERVSTTSYSLGQLYPIRMGGTPPSKDPQYYCTSGGTPWACVSDLRSDMAAETLRTTQRSLSEAGEQYLGEQRRIPAGSTLLSFKLSIGKVASAAVDMYCNEAIAFFPDTDRCLALYLFFLFQTIDLRSYGRGSIGNGNLNKELLQQICLDLPSREDQAAIVAAMVQRRTLYQRARLVHAAWEEV